MSGLIVLSEEQIEQLLRWDQVIPAVKQSLISVTNNHLPENEKTEEYKSLNMVNPQRIWMKLPSGKGLMLCMPGYIEGLDYGGSKENSLSCKILNILENNTNHSMSSISGYINLFDESGILQAILGAERITEWRTASLSVIATQLLWNRSDSKTGGSRILSIYGAGVQGRIHAIVFQQQFNFNEIRIWNRTASRAEKLVAELKSLNLKCDVKYFASGELCAKDADVIITATSAKATVLQDSWVKPGTVINVVGVGSVSEISTQLYDRSDAYVESMEMISSDMPTLKASGELGQLILGKINLTNDLSRIRIFVSRGMGIHDAAVSRLIYNNWKKSQSS